MSVNAVPDPPPDRTSEEPAMKVAGYTTIGTLVTSVVATLVVFGVDLNSQQQAAIAGLAAALVAFAPMASGWFTRRQVYAPATVARMLDEAEARPAVPRPRWPQDPPRTFA